MSLIQPTCSNCKYKFHENKTHCLGCYDSIREILTNHKFEETNEFYEIGKICFDIIKAVRFLNNEGFESCTEHFDSLSNERKQEQYDNMKYIAENINTITAEEEHKKWMELKVKDGWRYAEKTDRENKVHNCLMPFQELNFYQKLKDELAIATVKSWIKEKENDGGK